MSITEIAAYGLGESNNRLFGTVLAEVVTADGCRIIALANEPDVLVRRRLVAVKNDPATGLRNIRDRRR